jgi:hypothetical protein
MDALMAAKELQAHTGLLPMVMLENNGYGSPGAFPDG